MKKSSNTRATADKHRAGHVSSKSGQTDKPTTAGVLQKPATRTMQNDQLPVSSLDDPWLNLHPSRIWPD